jgi:hypothetical protein
VVRPSRRNDEALRRIMKMVEMPDRMAENLIRFIRLNEGASHSKANLRG